jgi:hypothetical protein
MRWTRLELTLVSLAVLLSLLMLGHRTYQHLYFENAADQITSRILQIAGAVETYHEKTGHWFPMNPETNSEIRVFPDPFDDEMPEYQGLDQTVLEREGNAGVILQLVRFAPDQYQAVPVHLFSSPFKANEPYLRVLLDYGQLNQAETETLIRVQARLPAGAIAELDDHYYVIDIRRFFNGK